MSHLVGVRGCELARIMCIVCGLGAVTFTLFEVPGKVVSAQLLPLQCFARSSMPNINQQQQQQFSRPQFSSSQQQPTQLQQVVNLANSAVQQQQILQSASNVNNNSAARSPEPGGQPAGVTQVFVLPNQLSEPVQNLDTLSEVEGEGEVHEELEVEEQEEPEEELTEGTDGDHEESQVEGHSVDEFESGAGELEGSKSAEEVNAPHEYHPTSLITDQDFAQFQTTVTPRYERHGLLKRRQVNPQQPVEAKTRKRTIWDHLRLRTSRIKRQASDPIASLEPLVGELLRMLTRGLRPASGRLQRLARQMLATASQAGELAMTDLLREQAEDLPVRMANLGQLASNLIHVLALENPVIMNSPVLLRAQQTAAQSQPLNRTILSTSSASPAIDALEALVRLLRSMRQPGNRETAPGQGALSNSGSPVTSGSELSMMLTEATPLNESTLPIFPDLEERGFVNRLNDLTTGRLKEENISSPVSPVRRRVQAGNGRSGRMRSRKKRSIGTMLMLAPFSKLYTAMLVNKMLKYQSGVLTQAVVSELIRRYLLPGTSSLVSSALSPATGYLNLMKQTYLSGLQAATVGPGTGVGFAGLATQQQQQQPQLALASSNIQPLRPNQISSPAGTRGALLDADCQLQLQGTGANLIQPPRVPFEPSLSVDQSTVSLSLSPETSVSVPNLFPGMSSLSLSRPADGHLDPYQHWPRPVHLSTNRTRPYGLPGANLYTPGSYVHERPHLHRFASPHVREQQSHTQQHFGDPTQAAVELYLKQASPGQLVDLLGQLSHQQSNDKLQFNSSSLAIQEKGREQRLSELLAELAEEHQSPIGSHSQVNKEYRKAESADALAEKILNRTLEMSLSNLLASRKNSHQRKQHSLTSDHSDEQDNNSTNGHKQVLDNDIAIDKQRLVKDTSDLLVSNFAQLIKGLEFEENKRSKNHQQQQQVGLEHEMTKNRTANTGQDQSPIQIVVSANSAVSLLERLMALTNPTSARANLSLPASVAMQNLSTPIGDQHLTPFEVSSPADKLPPAGIFSLDSLVANDSDFGSLLDHTGALQPPYQAEMQGDKLLQQVPILSSNFSGHSSLFDNLGLDSRPALESAKLWSGQVKIGSAQSRRNRKIRPTQQQYRRGRAEKNAEMLPSSSNLRQVSSSNAALKRKPLPTVARPHSSSFLQLSASELAKVDAKGQPSKKPGSLGTSSSAAINNNNNNNPSAALSPAASSIQQLQTNRSSSSPVTSSSDGSNLNNLAMALNVMNMVLLNQKLASPSNSSLSAGNSLSTRPYHLSSPELLRHLPIHDTYHLAGERFSPPHHLLLRGASRNPHFFHPSTQFDRWPIKRLREKQPRRKLALYPHQYSPHLYTPIPGHFGNGYPGQTQATSPPTASASSTPTTGTSSSTTTVAPPPPPTSDSSSRPELEFEEGVSVSSGRQQREKVHQVDRNHRTSFNRIQFNESVQLLPASPPQIPNKISGVARDESKLGYKFQSLNPGALSEPEHAARWNDVLLHLNMSSLPGSEHSRQVALSAN